MSVQLTSDDLARVRIPAELNRELDQFCSALKAQTLEAAVRRAADRSDGIVVIQQEEMTECLRDILNISISNVSVILPPVESPHDYLCMSSGAAHGKTV